MQTPLSLTTSPKENTLNCTAPLPYSRSQITMINRKSKTTGSVHCPKVTAAKPKDYLHRTLHGTKQTKQSYFSNICSKLIHSCGCVCMLIHTSINHNSNYHPLSLNSPACGCCHYLRYSVRSRNYLSGNQQQHSPQHYKLKIISARYRNAR